MRVRHGTLLNVYGKPARHGGWTFMPAYVELDGSSFTLDYRLRDEIAGHIPPVLRLAIEQGIDAAWVRARLANVFGFTPDPAEVEKALLYAGFVAVPEGEDVCYPFVCTDHYGKSSLMFSDGGPEEGVKPVIAPAFWGLLALAPEDLTDFEQRVHDPGAMVWLNYGCELGRVYCDETNG